MTVKTSTILFALFLLIGTTNIFASSQVDIAGPANSLFGAKVAALPNGNIVVVATGYDIPGGASNVGAVFMYNGSTGALISTMTGSTANDVIGDFGIRVVAGGNFVVRSSTWDNGAATDAGAVTWCSGTTGCNGTVSAANSLVGSSAADGVNLVTVLPNGNYIVISQFWNSGAIADAGAVTFCTGNSGCAGTISASTSMIGSHTNDRVGNVLEQEPFILTNGNFLIVTTGWDNGTATNVGAVTWCSSTSGCTGVISASNSLVGSTTGDFIGGTGVGITNANITRLSNGNYVVRSTFWDNGAAVDAGALTFGNGTSGVTGTVSLSNSLVGSTTSDLSGVSISTMQNGNYVVLSPNWDNAAVTNAGAATFGNGSTGVSGVISASTSLVGTTAGDQVGSRSAIPLNNGNFVIGSPFWDNGAITDAGAVTFSTGTAPVTGPITATNSLVGSTAGDSVGSTQTRALTNGNYVVTSSTWDNGGIIDAGASTFANGTTGIVGTISSSNSLVGSTANDRVGSAPSGAIPLTNGNYVVMSPFWDNGATVDAGAVTFCNGSTGRTGTITPSVSYIGSTAGDTVGNAINGAIPLTNGNYVFASTSWDNGAVTDAGAVTFGNGTTGGIGVISTSNSLVGSTANDFVNLSIQTLTNGNYVVLNNAWDNGSAVNAGAVTFGNGTTGVVGPVSAGNSLVGIITNDSIGNTFSRPFIELTSGDYVVNSPFWDNGAIQNVGAVTFGSGTTGISGPVSAANSLIGSTTQDQVGNNSISNDLPNGRYIVNSSDWHNSAGAVASAFTLGLPLTGISGAIDSMNSVRGNVPSSGASFGVAYDAVNDQMVVGKPQENIVTLFRPGSVTAAGVSISGRVKTTEGRGVRNARVVLTDQNGQRRSVITSARGYYHFDDVEAGQNVILSVMSRRFQFEPRVIDVSDNLTDIDFFPNPLIQTLCLDFRAVFGPPFFDKRSCF